MKTSKDHRESRWFRIAALLLGVLIIFWLPFEDLNESWVMLIAAAICILVAARVLVPNLSTSEVRIYYPILIGVLAGLAVVPMTIFLMIFKSGLHGHGTPEFTVDQVVAVLTAIPIWVIGGVLIGLGISLWQYTRSQ